MCMWEVAEGVKQTVYTERLSVNYAGYVIKQTHLAGIKIPKSAVFLPSEKSAFADSGSKMG
jgi:hypothetical protein